MKNNWNYTIVVILSIITIIIISVVSLTNSINDKIVWAIDSYTLIGNDSITLGENSDICYGNFKQGSVTLKYFQSANGQAYYDWKLDSTVLDTLPYMKINDNTINLVNIEKESTIHIGKITLKGNDIYNAWDKWENQEYIMLRNVIASQSKMLRSYKDSTFIRSCFAREKGGVFHKRTGKIKLILLDKYTSVDGKGYAFSGSFPTKTDRGMNCLKIQFFIMSESFLQEASPTKGMIDIDGVNYMAKPIVVLNKWGASHIMLRHNDTDETIVCFPRANMFVGDYDSLADNSKKTSYIMSLRQEERTFPTAYDLYVPQLSSSFFEGICPIRFSPKKKSYSLRLNENDSISFKSTFMPEKKINLLCPNFQKFDIVKPNVILHARSGFLNLWYILRFLYAPLLFLIVFMLFLFAPRIGYINVPQKKIFIKQQYRAYRTYMIAFFLIFFIYYICKVFITIKLSYTSPYFERLSLITPSSFIASLGLFLLLYAHLNFECIKDLSTSGKIKKVITIIIFCISGALYQYYIYKGNNSSILDSYFYDNIFNFNPKNWSDNPSIMDTNRNILYGLNFAEIIALLLLVLRLWIKPSWFTSCTKKVNSFLNLDQQIEFSFFKKYDLTKKRLFTCFLYIVSILLVGGLLSNFATAIITLCIIFGLEATLNFSKQAFQNNWKERLVLYGIIVCITVVFFIVAFLPDKGYLTNFIGFISAAILFIYLQEKDRIQFENKGKKKTALIYAPLLGIILFLLIVKVILPLYASEDTANYSRTNRRISMYADFDNQRNKGYRYSESDAEFMALMAHYTNPLKKSRIKADPISNDEYPLHSSFSSGQAPVILNDMSVPVAFLGCYGLAAFLLYVSLPLTLLLMVLTLNLKYFNQSTHAQFTSKARRAMLASFMWIGTTTYLYLSYRGAMPFTGRLNPGLGVDSLGEVMESTILFAFMTSIKFTKEQ